MMKTHAAIVSNYGVGGSLLYFQQLAGALMRKDYPVIYYLPENTQLNFKVNGLYRFIKKNLLLAHLFIGDERILNVG